MLVRKTESRGETESLKCGRSPLVLNDDGGL